MTTTSTAPVPTTQSAGPVTGTTVVRFAGGLLVAAAALCVAGGLAHPIVDGNAHSADSLLSPRSPWAQYLLLAGTVGLIVGLPLLYAHFACRLGRLGLVGFVLYVVGNATCAMAHLIVEAMVAVPLAADPATRDLVPADGSLFGSTAFQASQLVGGPLLLLGLVLLGIAVLRSGLPPWIGVALLASVPFGCLPLPEIAVLTGMGLELPRGLATAALAVIMLRELRRAETEIA